MYLLIAVFKSPKFHPFLGKIPFKPQKPPIHEKEAVLSLLLAKEV
jgi:hypothetical protein